MLNAAMTTATDVRAVRSGPVCIEAFHRSEGRLGFGPEQAKRYVEEYIAEYHRVEAKREEMSDQA
jgi:hypothetical protein